MRVRDDFPATIELNRLLQHNELPADEDAEWERRRGAVGMTWIMEEAWYGTLVEPIPGVTGLEQPIDAAMETMRKYVSQNPFPDPEECRRIATDYYNPNLLRYIPTDTRIAYMDRVAWLVRICKAVYVNPGNTARQHEIGVLIKAIGHEIAEHEDFSPREYATCVHALLDDLFILFKLLVPAYRGASIGARYWAGYALTAVCAGAGYRLDTLQCMADPPETQWGPLPALARPAPTGRLNETRRRRRSRMAREEDLSPG